MEDKKDGNVKEDSEVISRRSFMRKSAEVAALSLFGVMGLDAVTGRVLERIAESEAMGRLADSAARAMKKHRGDYNAEAASACGTPYKVNCPRHHECNTYSPACVPTLPFTCTDQHQFTCNVKFECGTRVRCYEGTGAFYCEVAFDYLGCERPRFDCPGYNHE